MSPDQRPLSNERGRHLTHYWVLFDQLNEPFGWYMWVKYLWIVQGWLFRNLEEETTPATITSWSATETFFLNLCSILHHFWRVSHFAGLNLRWPDKTAAGPPKEVSVITEKPGWILKKSALFWEPGFHYQQFFLSAESSLPSSGICSSHLSLLPICSSYWRNCILIGPMVYAWAVNVARILVFPKCVNIEFFCNVVLQRKFVQLKA